MSGSVSIKSASEGNTKLRTPASKYWCFTFNNYPKDKLSELSACFAKHGEYIFGEEIAPTTGTPHLQGYIALKKAGRPMETFNQYPSIHWEKCKGNREQNLEYCSKDGLTFTNIKMRKKVIDELASLTPYPWQQQIIDETKLEPDRRKIIWRCDDGFKGKNSLARHLVMTRDCLIVNSKGADIKCAVADWVKKRDLDIVIFCFPRSAEGYVSYGAIEDIKDGLFFSPKYESGMVNINPPHVYVFCNFMPDTTQLSADRWEIRDAREKKFENFLESPYNEEL